MGFFVLFGLGRVTFFVFVTGNAALLLMENPVTLGAFLRLVGFALLSGTLAAVFLFEIYETEYRRRPSS